MTKDNTDPKMKTVFDMTKDLFSHEGKQFDDHEVILDNETVERLEKLCELYGHDMETIVNGILSVAVNDLKEKDSDVL